MKLVAAGCSLVYGNELADYVLSQKHSQHTWSALLAQHLGLEYHCVAIPGTGSDSHVRTVLANVDSHTQFVAVGWSFAPRFEFDLETNGWVPMIEMQQSSASAANLLFKSFHSLVTPRYQWYHYVKNIVLLQTWLKAKNINYIFCAVDRDFGPEACADPTYQKLYNEIDWNHWYFWQHQGQSVGFLRWVGIQQENDSRFTYGPGGHPLEHAHRVTFEQIKQKISGQEPCQLSQCVLKEPQHEH